MNFQSNQLALFMTATDTGVGKTTLTAAIILALQKKGNRVGVVKPVETGIHPQRQEHSDTGRLRSLLSPQPSFEAVCLYAFPQPLAPLACARKAGMTIDIPRIVSYIHDLFQEYPCFIVEGAGGVFTPITPLHTMRDLMMTLNLPVLVVGRTTLGSVNHLFLTLDALQHAGIKTGGIVLNNPVPQPDSGRTRTQQASSVDLIRELTTVPVFGPVEFEKKVRTHWRKGVESLAEHPEIQRLINHLIESMK